MLACVTCSELFSIKEIDEGKYILSTMQCTECYAVLQDKSYNQSCFGKPTEVDVETGKPIKLGYDPSAIECSTLCPDRKFCCKIVVGDSL